MRDFFQGSADPTQFGAIRQQASRREQPTHGDGGANMQLIEVPWGCGYGVGLCSAGLAGRRCPEKEAQREQNLVNALQADGLSGEEIDLALLEEERLRHLQDVRALEFGFDPAIPVADDARMAARVIRWVSVDQGVFEKRPCSQLFGGALVIGVLDPVPEPDIQEPRRGRGRKKKSHGKAKGKGKGRTGSDISCHEQSHRRGPPPNAPNAPANPAPPPGAAARVYRRTLRTPKPSSRPDPAPGAADSTYGSQDQSPPSYGGLRDTDAETLATYGRAYPLHTELGRPIIDGSLEYWEALHGSPLPNPPAAAHSEVPASRSPRTVPTIRTESGRVLLQGTGDSEEVIADEVAGRMGRERVIRGWWREVDEWEAGRGEMEVARRQGLVFGQMGLIRCEAGGRRVVDGELVYYERPREYSY